MMKLFSDISEFAIWLDAQNLSRKIRRIQQHHTLIPGYSDFDGTNHFELNKGMRDYHVNKRGFSDIAQHFTTFPDGSIMTGRSLDKSPAGIKGANSGSICIEHLGNFDSGNDVMDARHRATIISMNALLCSKFNLEVNRDTVIYHHWWDLSKGKRTDGAETTKTCPGTSFFGGNKVSDAENNLYPLIESEMGSGNIPLASEEITIEPIGMMGTPLIHISPVAPILANVVTDNPIKSINHTKEVIFDNYDILVTRMVGKDVDLDSWSSMPSSMERASILMALLIFFLVLAFSIRYHST